MCRKWYKKVHFKRTLAVKKWQRIWRVYFRMVIIPRRQKANEKRVAPLIQKFLKGYLARKTLGSDLEYS